MAPVVPTEVPISARGTQLLTEHAGLLERWRKAMNLVGPGPIDVHYEDSARALSWMPQPSGKWADLGTGAGFPGIVFAALFTEVELELVDSRSKRCRFLEESLANTEWEGVTVRCMRHEGLDAGTYDGVFSRALHAPDRMVEVARRLLKPNGQLLLFLQDEAPVPTADDFEMFHVEHYVVEGKRRKCAALRRT